MKKMFAAMALTAGLAMPASAGFTVVTLDPAQGVASNNDFAADIDAWAGGSADFWGGAGLEVTGPGTIQFYFIAAESGWKDTFNWTGGSYTEPADYGWGPATWIGSMGMASGGAVTGLSFAGQYGAFSGGNTADLGVDDEFGIFTQGGQYGLDQVLFAFDDTCCSDGPDDNHDDIIILATWTSAIPEPATWLMMIMGFGLVGVAARRRSAIAAA